MKLEFIKKLIKLIEEMGIEEIEIRRFATSIRIRRGSGEVSEAYNPVKNPVQELVKKEETKEIGEKEGTVTIKAPMVGSFYRAPAPDAPPYVEIGDSIIPGQIICIVEAMKIMNEIESDVRGTIVDIFVKNDDPVEFNQKLFLVKLQ